MTVSWPPRTGPEVPAQAPGGTPQAGTARNAPVVVLTYGNAGGRRLQALLESQPELTCTASTGVLAACDQAATAWRQVEGRPAKGLSPLAVKSVRVMATQMITAITARSGRPRWCETAAAEPSAAETFLRMFPGTRFVCLHRACPDLIAAVLLASPWGVSGPVLAPYMAAYPGSTVAALTAWWVAHAGPVLDFERAHPGACMRVRYEDLAEDPDAALNGIRAYLGLGGPDVRPAAPAVVPIQAPADAASQESGADLPLDQIPPPLLAQVNELHAELGYPLLGGV
jgi:hypothetical protein